MKTLRRIIAGAALVAATAGPMLLPSPAQAWWHAAGWGGWHGGWGVRGWGWHPGWGWRPGWGWGPGFAVGVPPVVVGPPVYNAPGYAYRWIPGYWAGGVWIRPHWGYR